MKTENQIIDECMDRFLNWRSKCGAGGWYDMEKEEIRKFIKDIMIKFKIINKSHKNQTHGNKNSSKKRTKHNQLNQTFL